MAMRETDPFLGYNFRMEVDGIDIAGFTEIDGLEASVAVIEYCEGFGELKNKIKLPGRQSLQNVTFKRGVTTDGIAMWEWFMTSLQDGRDIDRKSITIAVTDDEDGDARTYTFTEAWPCRYKGPSLNSGEDLVAFEEIEFTYEILEVE